jgi:flagellar assembly factor FliW
VTIPASQPDKMSANLQGPLAINTRSNRAAQLILGESDYSSEHHIFEDIGKKLPEAAK